MKTKLINESLLNEDIEDIDDNEPIIISINENKLEELLYDIIEELEFKHELSEISSYLHSLVNIAIEHEKGETVEDEIEEIGRYHTHDEIEESMNEAKSKNKWIQKAIQHPGALKKSLGKKNGEKLSKGEINTEISKLKKKDKDKEKIGIQLDKTDSTKLRRLRLAKTLRNMKK